MEASLNRKVCNTLNTCYIVRSRAADLVPAFVESLKAAGRRLGPGARLHVVLGSEAYVDPALFDVDTRVARSGRQVTERFATPLAQDQVGAEWEWDDTPEVTLMIVHDLEQAISLFNQYSPHFVASLIAEDPEAHETVFQTIDAPFVGDGLTRWVDGQYALGEPELGLANWELGRPLDRSSVLTGAGFHTLRLRMRRSDPVLRR